MQALIDAVLPPDVGAQQIAPASQAALVPDVRSHGTHTPSFASHTEFVFVQSLF